VKKRTAREGRAGTLGRGRPRARGLHADRAHHRHRADRHPRDDGDPEHAGHADAREGSGLKADLHTFRDVIDQFFRGQGAYPEDIGSSSTRVLRAVPEDPFTKSPSTWVPVFATDVGQEDRFQGGKAGKRGIYDVKSGAEGTVGREALQ